MKKALALLLGLLAVGCGHQAAEEPMPTEPAEMEETADMPMDEEMKEEMMTEEAAQ